MTLKNLEDETVTLAESSSLLRSGAKPTTLAEAIGVLISSRESALDDIRLGLLHPGFIAEQAAIGLYRRTNRPIPEDRTKLDLDFESWGKWLAERGFRNEPGHADHAPASAANR